LRNKPLVVITDDQDQGLHFIQNIYNWSIDIIVCTNGKPFENSAQKRLLRNKGIKIMENRIRKFGGKDGLLEEVIFDNDERVTREGGFVLTQLVQSSNFAEQLGCKINSLGGISIDFLGRTNVDGVYAAGDTSISSPAQLIIAAAEGFRAGAGVNSEFIQKEFLH
jgi:thioredoxin reductase